MDATEPGSDWLFVKENPEQASSASAALNKHNNAGILILCAPIILLDERD